VLTPTSTTVSMPSEVRVDAREVPKKPLAYCFTTTTSPGSGATSGIGSPSGSPSTKWRSPRTLRKNSPPSVPPRA
jgi:hypothetical protein